ncbi:hypothetical protein [Venatoribacter cucullus]|uniref:hypothetical protein n=1 Tax=Venatoribacter cucullus TaxID=2661630 RepID=UPI0019356EB7|nr:hypothetical protein [Venatoribacter cucullus]QQD20641.1 hypothetical protein GJQ54_02160 [Oceanospirillaceae bacterium ASx5O]UZK02778.1 hypothetical protein GAY96_02115 [Venatoribacter cucullus]
MTPLPDFLQPVAGLPAASEEPQAGLAFYYNGPTGPHWLVYDVARDFLSAPRGFAVVQIQPGDCDLIELNSGWEYDELDYLNDGSMLQRGWFRLAPSPWLADDDDAQAGEHWLLSLPQQRCEFLAVAVQWQETLYHQPSAGAALQHWLAQHSAG